jgi:2-C-methyl-D-erythritol 2,4-cyclodiphosphate synthase
MIAAIGQDSHRFDIGNTQKKLILAGVEFEGETPLLGNSDADVILHAITNAISGISGVNILGKISDDLCLKEGVSDSSIYLKEALKTLVNHQLIHISISIECQKPKITPMISKMKENIAQLLELKVSQIGITATSGEGLTAFGRGEGIQAFVIISAMPL